MDEKMKKKYSRLCDRIDELTTLNTNIAKLAFYLNENKIESTECELVMNVQLVSMVGYRNALQDRIVNGQF